MNMMQIANELLTSLGYDGRQYMGDGYTIDGDLNTYLPAARAMMNEWVNKLANAWPEPLDLSDRVVKQQFRPAVTSAIFLRWREQCFPRYVYRNGVRVRVN